MDEVETSRRISYYCPPPPGRYPWLLYHHGEGYKYQTFCNVVSSSSDHAAENHCCTIPELRGKTVVASCHGWLVLCKPKKVLHYFCHYYSLYNPVTLESIDLPPLKLWSNQKVNYCTLSSPPGNPDSMFLVFEFHYPSIIFLRLADRQWIKRQYSNKFQVVNDDENERHGAYLYRPINCNGKLYATTFPCNKLAVIDILEPNSLIITLLECHFPVPRKPCTAMVRTYMAESCGELFIIFIMPGGMRGVEIMAIDIFKLDGSTMIWEKVESARDRGFFLGGGESARERGLILGGDSAISCPANELDREGGYIYFIVNGDKSLYAYGIEEKSISLSLPCPNLRTPWQTPSWVMPDIRLSDLHAQGKHKADKDGQGKKEDERNMGEQREEQHFLFDLPVDILISIADRLILIDHLNFRATCKLCRSVVSPIRWRTALMKGLQTHTLSPWLMLPHNDKGVGTFIDPKCGGRYFLKIPQIVGEATICSSKDGWLLMNRGLSSMMFFNPLKKAIIELPDLLTTDTTVCSFGFSSLPTSSRCRVVAIASFHLDVRVYITRPGKTEWVPIDCRNNLPFEPNHNSPVFYNRAFHFLGQDGNLGVLRIQHDGYTTWKVLEDPKTPCDSFHQNFLVGCDDDLLSVFVGKVGKWVKVFKLNRSTESWDKVKSLGHHMLYVSGSTSFSAVTKTPGMENKIYFPRLWDQDIIFYSLDTCKYHTFRREDRLMNYNNSRELLLCGWIEPSWSLNN